MGQLAKASRMAGAFANLPYQTRSCLPMSCLISVPDRHIPSLDDFRVRHAGCSDASQSMDGVPGDNLTYTFVPSTLGGVVEARCACGARWVLGDGEPYEVAAPSATEGRDGRDLPKAITHSVRILHLALTRPGIVLGTTGERALHDVESLWHGMELALFHAEGCEAFDQMIMEWTSLLYEGLGYPDDTITNMMRFRYSEVYLAAGMGWLETLRAWDRHLCGYMWREWPAVAEGARLPRA